MAEGFEKAWERARDVKGWYSREELEFLWTELGNAEIEPLSSVLEIGCYYGRSTSIIAEVCARRAATLWVIDPFYHRSEDIPDAKRSVFDVFEKSGVQWKLVESRSKDVKPEDLPQSFSAVHIDGSHEPQDVATDCQLALPKLRTGGIAAFHDWAGYMPGVEQGAGRFVENWPVVGQVGSCRIFRKA